MTNRIALSSMVLGKVISQAKAILADVSEMELNNGVRSERIQKIRYAFKADKIKLFYELDTNWSSRSELENVA